MDSPTLTRDSDQTLTAQLADRFAAERHAANANTFKAVALEWMSSSSEVTFCKTNPISS